MNKIQPMLFFIGIVLILNLAGSMIAATYGLKLSTLSGHAVFGINLLYATISAAYTIITYQKKPQ